MATMDESRVHCQFTRCPEIRSLPPRGSGGNSVREKSVSMKFCPARATCCCFFFFKPAILTSHHDAYSRALNLKLENTCSWIILSWDRFLEYPGLNYPEGDAERRNGAGSHFVWGVKVYFELCRYPGRGMRGINACWLYMHLLKWGLCVRPLHLTH